MKVLLSILLFSFVLCSGGSPRSGVTSDCGFYKCSCNSEDNSDHTVQINVLTNGIPTEIIKRQFYFKDEKCSSSCSYDIRTEYNVSRISASDTEYKYSIFPLHQYITFFDEDLLKEIQFNPALILRVPYDLASTLFDSHISGENFTIKREENYNKEIIIKRDSSKKIEFPDLSTNSVLSCEWVSDTGCKEYSAGSGEDGDVNVVIKRSSNWFLWLIIIVLVCVIVFLLYYRKNYRYLPITERKRIDDPEDRKVENKE